MRLVACICFVVALLYFIGTALQIITVGANGQFDAITLLMRLVAGPIVLVAMGVLCYRTAVRNVMGANEQRSRT